MYTPAVAARTIGIAASISDRHFHQSIQHTIRSPDRRAAVLLFGRERARLPILWLRVFGWVFGVTVYAASTVWASFMAGLALGSLIAAKAGDRARRPRAWFGAAELVIGATALASPALLHALDRVYAAAYSSLPHSLPALTLVRFVMALTVLIVPTTMMGTTLPLVVKSSAFRSGKLGERMGLLRKQHSRRDRRDADRGPVVDSNLRHPANVRDRRGAERHRRRIGHRALTSGRNRPRCRRAALSGPPSRA